MSFRTSFRSKLLFLSVAPLVVALSVTLLAVMRTVEQDVDRRARESLIIGGTVVAEFLAARQEQLHTSVKVLAADFGFKQAAATADEQTIRSVLLNHGRRVGADLAVFLDTDGRIIASTIGAGLDAADLSLPIAGYRTGYGNHRRRQLSYVFGPGVGADPDRPGRTGLQGRR